VVPRMRSQHAQWGWIEHETALPIAKNIAALLAGVSQ